jgi:hypothetical protein
MAASLDVAVRKDISRKKARYVMNNTGRGRRSGGECLISGKKALYWGKQL